MNPQEIINENIIAALGIQALPLEKKQEVLNKLVELVQKRIMLRVMDGLSKEDGEKMAELEKNPMEMLAFIAEKFPNFEEIVKEEVEKVKEEALSAAEQVGWWLQFMSSEIKKQELIAKMRLAYEEFVKYIEALEKEGDVLLRQNIQKIEKDKIAQVLKDIQNKF